MRVNSLVGMMVVLGGAVACTGAQTAEDPQATASGGSSGNATSTPRPRGPTGGSSDNTNTDTSSDVAASSSSSSGNTGTSFGEGASSSSSSSSSSSGDPVSTNNTGATSSSSSSGAAAAPAPAARLVADPASVDFGVLPANGTATHMIRVRNISGALVRLGTVSAVSTPVGGVTAATSLDGLALGLDGEAWLAVDWTQLASDQLGTVTIPVVGAPDASLTVRLFGAQQMPGASCSCPTAINTRPLETLNLTASCTDPAGTMASYRWTVESRPMGSTSNPTPDNVNATSFFVDLAGDYVLRFAGLPARGDALASCTVPVHVVPPQDLHVQLIWDTDESDVDMHLLGPGGSYFTPQDCYYANRNAAWGSAASEDNGTLDIDDTNGFGPENINVISPADGTYNLGVHYYCSDGITTPTRATVRVYCNGMLVRELQKDFNASREFWDVATIAWPACTVTEDTAPVRTVTQGCSR